jgi:hypothetical protein
MSHKKVKKHSMHLTKSNNLVKPIKSAPIGKEFFLRDGRVLKDLGETAAAFENMHSEVFNHHVNNEKNDFAMWFLEVLDDHHLAQKLDEVRNQEEYSSLIQKRAKELGFDL